MNRRDFLRHGSGLVGLLAGCSAMSKQNLKVEKDAGSIAIRVLIQEQADAKYIALNLPLESWTLYKAVKILKYLKMQMGLDTHYFDGPAADYIMSKMDPPERLNPTAINNLVRHSLGSEDAINLSNFPPHLREIAKVDALFDFMEIYREKEAIIVSYRSLQREFHQWNLAPGAKANYGIISPPNGNKLKDSTLPGTNLAQHFL